MTTAMAGITKPTKLTRWLMIPCPTAKSSTAKASMKPATIRGTSGERHAATANDNVPKTAPPRNMTRSQFGHPAGVSACRKKAKPPKIDPNRLTGPFKVPLV